MRKKFLCHGRKQNSGVVVIQSWMEMETMEASCNAEFKGSHGEQIGFKHS